LEPVHLFGDLLVFVFMFKGDGNVFSPGELRIGKIDRISLLIKNRVNPEVSVGVMNAEFVRYRWHDLREDYSRLRPCCLANF
jgi:hypothetical protein